MREKDGRERAMREESGGGRGKGEGGEGEGLLFERKGDEGALAFGFSAFFFFFCPLFFFFASRAVPLFASRSAK